MDTKKDQLKEKVVALVKDFVKTEGGINQNDLRVLFGDPFSLCAEVASDLAKLPISLADIAQDIA